MISPQKKEVFLKSLELNLCYESMEGHRMRAHCLRANILFVLFNTV